MPCSIKPFIAKVREYEQAGIVFKEAVKKAVFYCRDHDIMKEFLEKNASEIMNMLITEWNWDDAREVWQEEAREEGLNDGLRIAREEKLEIARKLKGMGIPIAQISKGTGFSIEEIEKM